eukprot:s3300_g4.t2
MAGHGPKGGHDPSGHNQAGLCPQLYDILDFFEAAANWATGMWHRHAANFKQHARAIIRSWLLLQTGALLALLRRGIRRCWQSPMGGAKRCPRILALLCLAYSLIGTATAHPSHGKPAPRSERAIREAEIEQWRHGLLTTREQMVRAWDRVLLEAPLTHSGGAVPDPVYETRARGEVIGDADDAVHRQVHVSCWTAAPLYETEIVDLEVAFPLHLPTFTTHVTDSITALPQHVGRLVPTEPQLHGLYASFVAVPKWLQHTDKSVLAIDLTAVGGTAFAVYHAGPVTRDAVLKHVDDTIYPTVDIYAFGRPNSLRPGQQLPAQNGGLIKLYPRGVGCHWSNFIEHWLTDVNQWNPHVEPFGENPGTCRVYHGPDEKCIYEPVAGDDRPHDVIAEDQIQLAEETTWTTSPPTAIRQLAHAGRRISQQIAVLEWEHAPMLEATVIFLDLRGLTYFPQWVVLPSDVFDPGAYVAGLQHPIIDRWTTTIEGGDPTPDGATVRVRHGETLTFYMEPSGTTDAGDGSSGDSDDEEDGGDSSDSTQDAPAALQ